MLKHSSQFSPSGRKWAFYVILHGALSLDNMNSNKQVLHRIFHKQISQPFTKPVNTICFVFWITKFPRRLILKFGIEFRSLESYSAGQFPWPGGLEELYYLLDITSDSKKHLSDQLVKKSDYKSTAGSNFNRLFEQNFPQRQPATEKA